MYTKSKNKVTDFILSYTSLLCEIYQQVYQHMFVNFPGHLRQNVLHFLQFTPSFVHCLYNFIELFLTSKETLLVDMQWKQHEYTSVNASRTL